MGRSCNVPKGMPEVARFTREDQSCPAKGLVATQISFFRGYEAGVVKRYIACEYVDAKGEHSYWARAYNGRNLADWEGELADLRREPGYREEEVPPGSLKRDWLRRAS